MTTDLARAALRPVIRIMGAIGDASIASARTATGLLVVDPRTAAMPAIHDIAAEMRWPVHVHDLARTNLNDLAVPSPLLDEFRHAGASDVRHVVVLRGYVATMADDKRLWHALRLVGARSKLMLLASEPVPAPRIGDIESAFDGSAFETLDLS